MARRVVVTGVGVISPLGNDWPQIEKTLKGLKNCVKYMKELEDFQDVHTRLAVPLPDYTPPAHYSRKQKRGMGRVAILAVDATERALKDAGLSESPELRDGTTGVSYGSCAGSASTVEDFIRLFRDKDSKGLSAMSYFQSMSHTCAANITVFFQTKGRVIPTCSACTSGSQGIGYAFESIKYGHQDIMIAGGAEEYCNTQIAVFDTLFATSLQNETPHLTPKPFDKNRDGLVLGEGACTLILEELKHAEKRGARIYAEVIGYGTNADGAHVTNPTISTMEKVMALALENAALNPGKIGYVNAHGTATDVGDIAESVATSHILGEKVPISSLKSYTGHTLGACGSLEALVSMQMMNTNWYHPNLNLEEVDPECARLDYIKGEGRELKTDHVMSNNFAFGGVNTSLIFKRCS